jgi:hypothetical protein
LLGIHLTWRFKQNVEFKAVIILSCAILSYAIMMQQFLTGRNEEKSVMILNLVVCILLRVLGQVQGFPSNATLFQ